MKFLLHTVPDEEPLHLEGELDSAFLAQGAKYEKFTGPLHYELEAERSSGGLLVQGSLSVPVEIRCVRCDNPFSYELRNDEFAHFEEELKGDEIDLTDTIREEILIELPDYPHCDEEGDNICPGHAILAENQEKAKLPPEEDGQSTGDTRWGGLDGLKLD